MKLLTSLREELPSELEIAVMKQYLYMSLYIWTVCLG
jgi:hypothetical protein